MLWKGDHFKDLNILIDVVVCFEDVYNNCFIVNSRRNVFAQSQHRIKNSYHTKEHRMMRSLPIHIRNGFILAKAVRIASISQPDNLDLFGLEEALNADDVITSSPTHTWKVYIFGLQVLVPPFTYSIHYGRLSRFQKSRYSFITVTCV